MEYVDEVPRKTKRGEHVIRVFLAATTASFIFAFQNCASTKQANFQQANSSTQKVPGAQSITGKNLTEHVSSSPKVTPAHESPAQRSPAAAGLINDKQ